MPTTVPHARSAAVQDPEKPEGIGAPIPTNTRAKCKEIMDAVASTDPWFGIEQECNYDATQKPGLASVLACR